MLILSIIFILLSNAVTLRRDKSVLYSRVSMAVLFFSIWKCYYVIIIQSLRNGIGLLGGLFHVTFITQIFQFFILFICIIILQLTAFIPFILNNTSNYKLQDNNDYYSEKEKMNVFYNDLNESPDDYNKNEEKLEEKELEVPQKKDEQFKIIEYPLIILFIISGALFLVSTSDLVSLFLSIELQSYGLYLLCTIYRNSELATSGGLVYFLLGGLSSCFILLASSLLYSNSGTTNLDGLYIITSLNEIANDTSNNIINLYKFDYINYSLIILSVGFLFKISAAPFHFWSPYVYDAIPTIVTTFVAIIAKISIFIFLLELVHYTSNSLYEFEFSWTMILLISSLLSLIIGSVLGLTQFRIKRLFAYSTISHLGFILLSLSINSIESIQAFFFYLIQYSISNLNAFFILLAIGYSIANHTKETAYPELDDKDLSPIQLIEQIRGYIYFNPLLSLSLTITIFSFIGIPPLVGFFAKQMVLSAALDNGLIFFALIAVVTSVISAVYYLNIVKELFFNPIENNIAIKSLNKSSDTTSSTISSHLCISISLLTLVILLFIVLPNDNLTEILAYKVFN